METITIQTTKKREIVDITDKVNDLLKKSSSSDGIMNLFITHTTASLSTADLDPGTDLDMLDAFEAIIPHLNYRHPHNPKHVPDHILSTLIGTSLTIPYHNKELILGTWQRVVVIEFDGPRERQIILNTS